MYHRTSYSVYTNRFHRGYHKNAFKTSLSVSFAFSESTRDVNLKLYLSNLGPKWFFPSQTTAESRDIIVAMLNPDPTERLNIDQVLSHP